MNNWKKITLGIVLASCVCGSIESVVAQEDTPINERSIDPGAVNSAFDGNWRLRWRDRGGLLHNGRLFMDGNFGTLIVNVRLPNGRLISAQQEMTLISQRDKYILRGFSPTYPGSTIPNRDYRPDTFEIRQYGYNSLSVKNCSSGDCYPVDMSRIGSNSYRDR